MAAVENLWLKLPDGGVSVTPLPGEWGRRHSAGSRLSFEPWPLLSIKPLGGHSILSQDSNCPQTLGGKIPTSKKHRTGKA